MASRNVVLTNEWKDISTDLALENGAKYLIESYIGESQFTRADTNAVPADDAPLHTLPRARPDMPTRTFTQVAGLFLFMRTFKDAVLTITKIG